MHPKKLAKPKKRTKTSTNGTRKRSKAGSAKVSSTGTLSTRASVIAKRAVKETNTPVTKISRPYLAPLGRSEIGLVKIKAAIRKASPPRSEGR